MSYLRVALIDDEQNALDYLEDLLLTYEDIEVVGKYIDPVIGTEEILKADIDLLFLDINMPGISGINLAAKIKEKNANIFIAFVTAYDEYAVDAFGVEAVDYLMKPVIKDRLDETIMRVKNYIGHEVTESKLRITMLQPLQFTLLGREPISIHFKMTKVQHLFIYLLHNRARLIRKEHIIDMLWADLGEKNAFSQLYNAIYMIRKELEPYARYIQVTTFSDSYRLDLTNTIVDVDEFELAIPRLPSLNHQTILLHQQIIDSFSGNFLEDYDYLWVETERYRLQTLWINIALDLLHWYYLNKRYDSATNLCVTMIEISPLTEEAYFYLMKINSERKTDSAVHYHYSQLRDVLHRKVEEEPSQKIRDWYENWRKNKNK